MSDQFDEKTEIAQGLSQLGETTTAADLLRQKGQTKKLRVISERQLMDWILRLLRQHMAGKADAYSDQEKSELLQKAQEELNRRIQREQEAQAERDRLKAELEQAMQALAQHSSAQSQADVEAALAALRQKLDEAEQVNLDLQQDNYDLQDQLNEKMALLATTIAEKDKLRETVRNQMRRMAALCEGVIGIDNEYYGARHQQENPVPEDAPEDEQFYHDFDVGAKVIATLRGDLERLRALVRREEERQAEAAAQPKLLEQELALLEQLKEGSLKAADVAAPVAGLLEALAGARQEAEACAAAIGAATGMARAQTLSPVPEDDGMPAETIAAATGLVRELAASLAQAKNSIQALKALADDSDQARNATEQELEGLRGAFDAVCRALRERAEAEHLAVPAALAGDAPPEARMQAALQVLADLHAASPVEQAAAEQLALTDRLVRRDGGSALPPAGKREFAERLRRAGAELERYTLDLQRQLDEALARERALAERIAALAAERQASAPEVAALQRALELRADPATVAAAAQRALETTLASAAPAAQSHGGSDARTLASAVVAACAGDASLADRAADLAIAAEIDDPAAAPALAGQVRDAIAALGERRRELAARERELAEEAQRLRDELARLEDERRREASERADQQRLELEARRWRTACDEARQALDAVARVLAQRVPDASPTLSDATSEPAARAAAALEAIERLAAPRPVERAAADALATLDRALAIAGGPAGPSAPAASALPHDDPAARLRGTVEALERRVLALNDELAQALARERELARQVRDLSAAQAALMPEAVPVEDLRRVDQALAAPSPAQSGAELSEATQRLIADLKQHAATRGAEAARLAEQNRALQAALDRLTAELAQRSAAAGRDLPQLRDPALPPEVKAAAAQAALAQLAERHPAEEAAREHLQAAERLLAASGAPAPRFSEGLRAGDAAALAARVREADAALEAQVRTLTQKLADAERRERELARQVRELTAALASPIAPAAAPAAPLPAPTTAAPAPALSAAAAMPAPAAPAAPAAAASASAAADAGSPTRALNDLLQQVSAQRAEAARLAEQNRVLQSALDRLTAELAQRSAAAGRDLPQLRDPALPPEVKAAAAQAALAQLAAQRHPVDDAARSHLETVDRLLAASGAPAPRFSEGLRAGDAAMLAARMRDADAALEMQVRSLAQKLADAERRERELARQVRELTAVLAPAAPPPAVAAAPAPAPASEALQRLDQALSAQAPADSVARAAQQAIADLAQQAVQLRSAPLRTIAGDLATAARQDPVLAEQTAGLAQALERPAADPATLEAQTRAAIAAMDARRQALQAECERLQGEVARLEQARTERAQEATRLANEASRLRAQNTALRSSLDQLTAELAQRALIGGHAVPPGLQDAEAPPEARAKAALAAVAALTDRGPVEEAAREHLQAAERLLAATDGPRVALAEGLRSGDQAGLAGRLREADGILAQHLQRLHRDLDEARQRERELARQVRELATVAAANAPAAIPREELARLERAVAEPGADAANAARPVVAALKTYIGQAEQSTRGGVVRSLADELVKAGQQDPNLAEATAPLAMAMEANATEQLEHELREALLKLAARKRQLELERTRFTIELEKAKAERAAALRRADEAERQRMLESERLQAEIASLKQELEQAQADANEFRARNEATGTQFSSEILALRQELSELRTRHQDQAAQLSALRQQLDAAEVRLKRQREELLRGLEERDALIAEKDRIIDQLTTQRIDAKALQAKIQVLTVELDAANARIRELEERTGEQAGAAVRSGDLAELHKRTMTERDQLREQKRRLEAELADARAQVEQMSVEVEELRRSYKAEAEAHARDVATLQQTNANLKDALRKLHEEVAGIKARLRRGSEA